MRRAGTVTIAFGLAGFALIGQVTVNYWSPALLSETSSFLAFLMILILGPGVSLALPMIVLSRLVMPGRRRPVSFRLADGSPRFVIPESATHAGLSLILVFWLAGNLPDVYTRVADGWQLVDQILATITLVVGTVAFAARMRRPAVVLTAEGIGIRRLWRLQRIAWDELMPGGPPSPDRETTRSIPLYLREWIPSQHRYRWETLPIGELEIRPTFLTQVIRHYVEHPEHRSEIGTPGELARLQTLFPTVPTSRVT